MIIYIFLLILILFFIAYFGYNGFLSKKIFELNNKNPTPAHTLKDNIDYVPTHPLVLFGHHFSSIAGAGPIIGPIITGLAFGWLPALLWIIIGSIFIGGVHDFSSLVASIRHKGRSIAEIAKEYMSKRVYKLFLIFIWLSLIYVLIVFIDLTANTFKMDGGVATSSILYIFLAIIFGISLYKLRLPLAWLTLLFVCLVFVSIWIGQIFPLTNIPVLFGDISKTWSIFLIIYCFLASILPVWFLLQPRDYLSSYLLYVSVFAGVIGIIFGGFGISYPGFISFYAGKEMGSLFPMLFVTIACGAVSGFHSLIASGTTSKQLYKETDAKIVGYGAMLVEGIVAVIALTTLMMIVKNDEIATKPPLVIYATGIGKFVEILGIPSKLGFSFGLLALSTFILTTLDTATRVGRYIFQEFFSLTKSSSRYFATFITLILPTIFVLINLKDAQGNIIPAWKIIWPVFGTSNQLLASLVLLTIAVWLKKINKRNLFIIIPAGFMMIITLWALVVLIMQYGFNVVGIIAFVLFILALILIKETFSIIFS